MRDGALAPMGSSGGIVEIDETIYGRASMHPKGRGLFGSRVTNAAHKNVVLSLNVVARFAAITLRAAPCLR